MIKYILILFCLIGCTKKHLKKDIKEAKPARVDTLKGWAIPLTLLLLFISFVASSQTRFFMRKASPAAWTEIRIDTRASGTSSASTYNMLAGDPDVTIVSLSNLNDINGTATGVGISTIDPANWSGFGGSAANNSVAGVTGGSVFTGANASVYQSIHYNYGTTSPARYDITKAQYKLTGLIAGRTYAIDVAGVVGTYGFDGRNAAFIATGSTTTTAVELDCGPGGGSGLTTVATYQTMTLSPNSSGEIYIYMNSMSTGGTLNGSPVGSDIAVCAAIIVKDVTP